MFIPGELIALLTFPGVIVHEAAHQLACRFFGVAVLDVCYFRYGNPAGFVVHERPARPSQQIWIGAAPILVNTLAGILIALPAVIPVFHFSSGDPIDYLLVWLGVSIAMHAFPSAVDAKSIWQTMRTRKTSFLAKMIGAPLALIFYLASLGSVLWLDLIYGVTVTLLLPQAAIWIMI